MNLGAFLLLIKELINESYGFILLLIYNLSVNLGCPYIGVPKQLAGSVDVRSKGKHHRGKGVPGGVHNLSKSNGK